MDKSKSSAALDDAKGAGARPRRGTAANAKGVEAPKSEGREVAAVLAALTASVAGVLGDDDAGAAATSRVAALLAQLGAREAGLLREVLPGLTRSLRAAMEACLLDQQQGSGEARYMRLRRVLELVAAVSCNPALPAEEGAGEMLAIAASVLLHRCAWAPAAEGAGRGREAKRARVEAAPGAAAEATAQRERMEGAVRAEVGLRSYAAAVFAAVVEAAASTWPEVSGQAADLLLDALAEGVAPEGEAQSACPLTSGWEVAYGAASGLASLRAGMAPPELVAPWADILARPLHALAKAEAAGLATGELGRAEGEAGLWRALWAARVGEAVDRAVARHSGGGGSRAVPAYARSPPPAAGTAATPREKGRDPSGGCK